MRIELVGALKEPLVLSEAMGARLSFFGGAAVREIGGISTDTRELRAGDLFVAIGGQHYGADAFLGEALSLGAAVLLTDGKALLPSGRFLHFLSEEGGVEALLRAANYKRKKASGRVIAITGSAGKTTLKEAAAALLAGSERSGGNFNSTLGMPLSLLSFGEGPFWVLELGINHKGEMERMTRAAMPHIAVVTSIGSAHIGHFGDVGTLASEKLSIAKGLVKGGSLLVPASLPVSFLPTANDFRIFRVGREETADFRAVHIKEETNGLCCDLKGMGREITNLIWPQAGEIGVCAVSFTAAIGVLCGMDDGEIREGILRAGALTPRWHTRSAGKRELIDDTYNASPEAMVASLTSLRYRAGKRGRVAVLGDMGELGVHSIALHRAVGTAVAREELSLLLTYGEKAREIAAGAIAGGMAGAHVLSFSVGEEEALCEAFSSLAPNDAVALFKASRSMKMERILERIGGV